MLEKIVELLGASPTQYRQLLKAEKLVDKRALEGKRGTMLSLALNCAHFLFHGSLDCIYAIPPFGRVHLRTDQHNHVHGNDRHLDHPILRYASQSYTLSYCGTHASFIANLFSRKVDTGPHAHRTVVSQFQSATRLSLVSGFMSESLLNSYSSFRLHTCRLPSCQAFSRLV